MKRTVSTWAELEALGIEVKIDPALTVRQKGRLLRRYAITAKHPYGKDRTYYGYMAYFGKQNGEYKQRTILESTIIWLYYNKAIPEGYDIDHVNNDTSDNSIGNLQLLTRKQNNRKDHKTWHNQYTKDLTDAQIAAYENKEKA